MFYKTLKVFLGILCFSGLIYSECNADSNSKASYIVGGTNLPYHTYILALGEYPEYDDEYDYTQLKTLNILSKINSNELTTERFKKNIVDKVVIIKSQYKLFLYKKNEIIRTYLIALGLNSGPKEFEGDKKTPEGEYVLDYKKHNSSYYKAFHISYPNAKDIAHAKSLGKRPGGMIMLHGQPSNTVNGNELDYLQPSKWTNGCIALLNPDIDELLQLVDPGTPIIIKP